MQSSKTEEYRNANIEEMLSWSLEQKEEHALKRVKEFKEAVNGKLAYGFSGGKDSCVLEHIVLRVDPDAVGVFSNTTNEYLELIKFVKSKSYIKWVMPKIPFKETVKKYGFPLVSKKVARSITDLRNPTERNKASRNLYLTGLRQDGKKSRGGYKLAKKWYPLIDAEFDTTNKCCDILKKEPLKRWQEENPKFYFLDGTTISEGGYRRMSWLKYGCNVMDSDKPHSRPLSIFTEKDIWDYIKKYKLPYCELYDDVEVNGILVPGEKRLGCKGCGFGVQFEKGLNRFERYALRNPKAHKRLMELTNNGVSMYKAYERINLRHGYIDINKPKGLF